ncbi:MAG: MBL fold metallo-hydrolase [Chitinophagaceae bacterium]
MKEVKLYLNYAGYCYAKESHAIRNGSNRQIKFHALFGLIKHPQEGWILYDTGYTRRFYTATRNFPQSIYAGITRVVVSETDEVKHQLQCRGLSTSDIRHIIITHFHADHIGGLKDFDKAMIHCSGIAYHEVKNTNSFWGFARGILKSLIPDDMDQRVMFIEDSALAVSDKIFGTAYDLFHDNSLLLYPVPGHAAGQLALLLKTTKQFYFLIADACWLKQSYQDLVLPNPLVKLFFNSWKDFKCSLQKIHQFHNDNPHIAIVPTHCFDTTSKMVSLNLSLDEL